MRSKPLDEPKFTPQTLHFFHDVTHINTRRILLSGLICRLPGLPQQRGLMLKLCDLQYQTVVLLTLSFHLFCLEFPQYWAIDQSYPLHEQVVVGILGRQQKPVSYTLNFFFPSFTDLACP